MFYYLICLLISKLNSIKKLTVSQQLVIILFEWEVTNEKARIGNNAGS
jgi:hypothetical protein